MSPRPIALVFVLASLLVEACGAGGASVSASPSAPAAAIELQRAPANLGCDTMAVDYRQVRFVIDAAAAQQVTAEADTGRVLGTFWSDGFVGGTADDPVVRDPEGQVVAADGQVLAIPEGQFPRLAGYFVCPSTDALYVLIADPE